MQHTFNVPLFLPSLHDYDAKMPTSGNEIFFPFLNLDVVLRN